MIQVFSQVSLLFPRHLLCSQEGRAGTHSGTCSCPPLPESAQLGTFTHPPGKGQFLALEQNLTVPLPQILGFLEPAHWAGSGPELGMGSLGLIGTLPGPAARGLLSAKQYPHSSLWQAPARAGYQPLYPVGRSAARLLNQPPQPCFYSSGTLPPYCSLSRVDACCSHTQQ